MCSNPSAAPTRAPGPLDLETIQRRLVSIWCEVIDIAEIGIADDFLELGGDSVMATRIASRVAAEWNVNLQLEDFFERQTIRALALRILEAVLHGPDWGPPHLTWHASSPHGSD